MNATAQPGTPDRGRTEEEGGRRWGRVLVVGLLTGAVATAWLLYLLRATVTALLTGAR